MNYHHLLNPYGSISDMTTRVTAAVQLGGSTPAECITYAQRAYDDLTKFCASIHGWTKPSLIDQLNLAGQNPLWASQNMTDRRVLSERARVIVHLNNLHLWLTTKHPVEGEIEAFWDKQIYPAFYEKREMVSLFTTALDDDSISLIPNGENGRHVVFNHRSVQPSYAAQQWSKLVL